MLANDIAAETIQYIRKKQKTKMFDLFQITAYN